MIKHSTTADEIKVWLLNWLLPRLQIDDILGSEVRLLDSAYRVDLMLATPTKLIGFEIKGPRDSLRRLTKQADAYDLMFHASYLVCRESDFAEDLLPSKMGIIGIQPSPKIVREPRLRKRITKAACAKWLIRKDLEALLGRKGRDVEELRKAAEQSIPAETLDQFAVQSVRRRLLKKHLAFTSELGSLVTRDDLVNLNSEPQTILLP